MMPEHSDHRPVPLSEWAEFQVGLAHDFGTSVGVLTPAPLETQKDEADIVVETWGALFAKIAGELCREYGLPIETLNEACDGLGQKVADHFPNLKWLRSEKKHEDSGSIDPMRHLKSKLIISESRAKILVCFPFITDAGEYSDTEFHEESVTVDLPKKNICA